MDQPLRIEQLRQACNLLLDQVESAHGAEVDLDLAEYWTYDLESAYTCSASPTTLAGDFREDVEEIDGLLARPDDEMSLWHDLDHLTGILRGSPSSTFQPSDRRHRTGLAFVENLGDVVATRLPLT